MKSFILLISLLAVSYAGQIVANKDAGISSLSKADAKNIFDLKTTTWGNGSKVHVYLLPAAHTEEEKFASTILGSNAAAVYDKWVAYVLNGGANKPPKTVNERKMSKMLKKKSGAIGILPDEASLPENTVVVLKY